MGILKGYIMFYDNMFKIFGIVEEVHRLAAAKGRDRRHQAAPEEVDLINLRIYFEPINL